jgi:hypothetical protein
MFKVLIFSFIIFCFCQGIKIFLSISIVPPIKDLFLLSTFEVWTVEKYSLSSFKKAKRLAKSSKSFVLNPILIV